MRGCVIMLAEVSNQLKENDDSDTGRVASTLIDSLTDPGTQLAKGFIASTNSGVFDDRTNTVISDKNYKGVMAPMKNKYKLELQSIFADDMFNKQIEMHAEQNELR